MTSDASLLPAARLPEPVQRVHGLIEALAASPDKRSARPIARSVRREVRAARMLLPPIAASLLARVARDAEAASGAVIDKGLRLAELQQSWDLLLHLLGGV